ncbi:hypothetical protein M441DRAFT_445468, partial [Trichoderma asperellum CBS 433.97]
RQSGIFRPSKPFEFTTIRGASRSHSNQLILLFSIGGRRYLTNRRVNIRYGMLLGCFIVFQISYIVQELQQYPFQS